MPSEFFTDAATSGRPPVVLNVPGLGNSGPGHWQTRWEQKFPWVRRVELGGWDDPDRATWVQRLDSAIRAQKGPVILVAHSLGCVTVGWWAALVGQTWREPVAGALLVAPADCERQESACQVARFGPMPRVPLPFPSLMVASRNDPYASFPRSESLARAWGSHLVDAGEAGHLNAQSGLGDWPLGLSLVDRLAEAADIDRQSHARLEATAQFHSRPAQHPQ